MSNLTDFARAELTKAGLFDKDSDYEGMIGEAVMELIEVFSKQGHSGFSAGMTRTLFDMLANYKPITPITSDPNEWMEVGTDVWQSKRCHSCFSKDGGKTWYDIDKSDERDE